jgi:hypothetical protein
MQSDENRSALRIRRFRTVIKGGAVVRLARQEDAKALRLERNSQ